MQKLITILIFHWGCAELKLWYVILVTWPTDNMYRENPMRIVGYKADRLECVSQDVLSPKALLNLHLPSLEMIKVFIHIYVSLSSSSAFLQVGILLHYIVL